MLRSLTQSSLFRNPRITNKLFKRSISTSPILRGEMSKFPGAQSEFTPELNLTSEWPLAKCFRRSNLDGKFLDPDYQSSIELEDLVKMYKEMTTLNVMDQIFYDAQRQGRISFYMTSFGEEATHIGSASALDKDDLVFSQYREAGVFMWRGFTLDDFANQCCSNMLDLGKGRQMPVHYGSLELNCHTISSPLATQLPQAAGAAYAYKRQKSDNIVVCYFGDGAASEGDFHTAMNFASTLDCPVMFFCRNNGYAISTPTSEQYRGDGIISRMEGYGITSIRVDGNDIHAVHDATAAARKLCWETNRPVFIEAMTYRGGHHSTSDDSSAYRSTDEIESWMDQEAPLTRVRVMLENNGLWDSEKEVEFRVEMREKVMESLSKAENTRKPAASQMFADVYDELPWHLQEQTQQMREIFEEYGDSYGLDEFEEEDKYVNPAETAIEYRENNVPSIP